MAKFKLLLLQFLIGLLVPSSLLSILPAETLSNPSACSAVPQYAKDRGISSPVFATTDRFKVGLTMQAQLPKEQLGPVLQLSSWTKFGKLGPFALNSNGEIFIAPVPSVNASVESFEKQNLVLKVSAQNGELTELLKLPMERSPSNKNPFGIVGLAYDCETKILYASSVSGSTMEKEIGKVFAIDTSNIQRAQIIDTLVDMDVIGLGLVKFARHKQIFLGSARSSEIFTVELDPKGKFLSKPHFSFRLDKLDEVRARKIRLQGTELNISSTEFFYNLVAQSEFKQLVYSYKYNEVDGTWSLVDFSGQEVLDMGIIMENS